jgi:hypothetical protein
MSLLPKTSIGVWVFHVGIDFRGESGPVAAL